MAWGQPRGAEWDRLFEDELRQKNWKRWGPYLSERQWGTVREDYSPDGDSWSYLPHDHARSRAYRWGEDGLLGITDRECRLCFALALWNGRDPILKERLFREDPHWRSLSLFHEFFHGDTGQGLGASHHTGWTALVVRLLEDLRRIGKRGRATAPAGLPPSPTGA